MYISTTIILVPLLSLRLLSPVLLSLSYHLKLCGSTECNGPGPLPTEEVVPSHLLAGQPTDETARSASTPIDFGIDDSSELPNYWENTHAVSHHRDIGHERKSRQPGNGHLAEVSQGKTMSRKPIWQARSPMECATQACTTSGRYTAFFALSLSLAAAEGRWESLPSCMKDGAL